MLLVVYQRISQGSTCLLEAEKTGRLLGFTVEGGMSLSPIIVGNQRNMADKSGRQTDCLGKMVSYHGSVMHSYSDPQVFSFCEFFFSQEIFEVVQCKETNIFLTSFRWFGYINKIKDIRNISHIHIPIHQYPAHLTW